MGKGKAWNGKMKEIVLLGFLGALLCLSIWLIFTDGKTAFSSGREYSESETKLTTMLEEMKGVGEAEVMICETEEGVLGVVIVCEGANDLQVHMRIREAVATALGTEQGNVKIYLKK